MFKLVVHLQPQLKSFARWLYSLILVIDANFRLKLKEKGIEDDPALGDGWAHWVSSKPYQAYIKEYGYQAEVRHDFHRTAINV